MLQCSKLSSKALQFKGLNHECLQNTVLATIINAKILRLEHINVLFSKLDTQIRYPKHSLYKALASKEKRNFILECKQSSPTLGDYCHDFNLDKLVSVYNNYASAISVLCEEDFFKGDISYLNYVKKHTNLPVICKDFIICKEQIKLAKVAGADAILLMLSILEPKYFKELFDYAKTLDLDVLCEVSTEDEAKIANKLQVPLVGINNRNLKTLEISFARTQTLLPKLKNCLVISESGIKNHQDLLSLPAVNGYLIGSSLCADIQHLELNLKALMFGKNKVCGINNPELIQCLIANKLYFAGLIFAPNSKRLVDIQTAQQIINKDPHNINLNFVGVFYNQSFDVVNEYIKTLDLKYIQLHGEESPRFIEKIKTKNPDIKIIKAFAITDNLPTVSFADYDTICEYFLLDSKNPGNNQSFDHQLLDNFTYAHKSLLAGGINSNNFDEAFKHNFCGVDINSAAESTPGHKDQTLINTIFSKINQY